MDHNISGPSHSYNVLYSILSWKQPLGEIIGYIMYCQEQKKVSRKGVAKHISLFIKYLFLWHLSLIKIFNAFLLFCCLIYHADAKYWNQVKSPYIVWESYIDHYIMIKAVKRFCHISTIIFILFWWYSVNCGTETKNMIHKKFIFVVL